MQQKNKIVLYRVAGSLIVAVGIIGAFWIRHEREKRRLLIERVLAQAGSNSWSQNPPYMAALCGDVPHLKEMLDIEPEILNEDVGVGQSTLLHAAALRGKVGAVELLLSRGADVNAQNGVGQTPLYACVSGQGNQATALLLLKHGADVSIPDHKGRTPLQAAIQKNRLEMVTLLQQHGAK